ncbi:MAG: hypothetical protein LC753_06625 [Acidobacteria bacterium]|nr:hypothetical protein [Acidobacteriota bacterium]MCA1649963.1 hypothetical protein [Acidobacteriota bacterium]
MTISLRLREVPLDFQHTFRGAIESALDGDWSVTLSKSHLDGQWHLQLDGMSQRYRIVLPALEEVSASRLEALIRQLVAGDNAPPTRPPTPRASADARP